MLLFRYSLIAIFTLAVTLCKAEESRLSVKIGGGYFGDLVQFLHPGFGSVPKEIKINPKVEGHIFHGKSYFIEFNYLQENEYKVSYFIQSGKTNYFYNDPYALYWDQKGNDTFSYSGIIFSKHTTVCDKIQFDLGLGMIVRFYKGQRVDDSRVNLSNYTAWLPIYYVNFWDIGALMRFECDYAVMNNLSMGIQLDVSLLWQIGIETIAISPCLIYYF